MKKTIFLLILIFNNVYSVIYRLNDTMYYKMPPVLHIEEYAPCLSEPESVYCTTNFELVSDTPSELLSMIREYSEHRVKHYNHSELHYGICVTKSCKEYYYDESKKGDLRMILEACLNDTFGRKYELKTKVKDLFCNTPEDKIEIDYADYAVAVICLSLLMINVIGSCYDLLYVRNNRKGNKFLLIFSIKRNWEKLIAPSNMSNPHTASLGSFHGIRTIMTTFVIIAHCFILFMNAADNTRSTESIYDHIFYHTFTNGTLTMQVFFLMSGFLLAYNIQLKSNKNQASWLVVLKGILLRWLRLSPPYLLVLAITCTWLRVASSGPLWHMAVGMEIEDCRRDYWQNLLYINNYFENTQCMRQTWYLAADMQLHILGLVVCVLVKCSTSRKVILSLLFIAGLIIPGVITYLMDLDAIVIFSPEILVHFFLLDPTFNNVYIRGYNNLSGYVIGLCLGYLTYHLINIDFKVEKFKKYLWMHQLLVPTGIMVMWMGSIFFKDAPQHSAHLRGVYAAIVKPIYALIAALFILGLIFKCDSNNRSILEWRCWIPPGRLTYCAYIVHVLVIRFYLGTVESLITPSLLNVIIISLGITAVTFILATPMWIMVESPVNQLVKLTFTSTAVSKETKLPLNETNMTPETTS